MVLAYTGWRYGNANWTTGIHGTVPSGRVCGSLRGNGKVLATVCEPIPWAAPTTSMWH